MHEIVGGYRFRGTRLVEILVLLLLQVVRRIPAKLDVFRELVYQFSSLLLTDVRSELHTRSMQHVGWVTAISRARFALLLAVSIPFSDFEAVSHQGGLILLPQETVLELHNEALVHSTAPSCSHVGTSILHPTDRAVGMPARSVV